MTLSRGAASVLSITLPVLVAALPAVSAAAAPGRSPTVPAAGPSQVTGEPETELELTPAEHGRLVDVLATEEERAEWRALGDGPAREAFLERFWSLRDPTPGTADNEARDLFMRRAARAERLFGGDDGPGWATPRGRALLVYGLPDEQERRSTGEEPELRWTWSDAPGSLTIRFSPAPDGRWIVDEDSDPRLGWEAFAANARERLRLPVRRAEHESRVEDDPGAVAAEGDEVDAPGAEAPAGESGAVEPPPMPAETVAWLRMVRDGEVRRDFPMEHRVYFFPAPDGTFMLVGFSLATDGLTFEPAEPESDDAEEAGPGDEGPEGDPAPAEDEPVDGESDPTESGEEAPAAERASLRTFGGVLGTVDGETKLVHQFNIPFTVTRELPSAEDSEAGVSPLRGEPAPAAGEARTSPGSTREPRPHREEELGPRSFGVTLTPGTYRLAWGVLDAGSDRMTMSDEVVRVPAFRGDELQLSSIILARPPHSEAEGEMSVADVYEGLRLGSSLLDADIGRVFGRDERFEVVFIVDGWQEDETTPGRPRLEVEYRILVVEADGGRTSIARLPVQELSFHAVGQEIPLSQIRQIEPGGSYEVEVGVRDLVAGTRVVEIVPFSVAPEPGAAEDGDG